MIALSFSGSSVPVRSRRWNRGASFLRLHKADDVVNHAGIPQIVVAGIVDEHLLGLGSDLIQSFARRQWDDGVVPAVDKQLRLPHPCDFQI